MNKIKLPLKGENFENFIETIKSLTKINNTIKIKITKDEIFLYSILGEQIMLAFKNHCLKTTDILNIKDDFDSDIEMIITNATKFVKNLSFLKTDKLTIQFDCKNLNDSDVLLARNINITDGKLKITWLCSEHYEIKDIKHSQLLNIIDLDNKKWSFKINSSDFGDVKRLSTINENKLIDINVSNGDVMLSETSAWSLNIDKISTDINENLILNKKFLNSIEDDNLIEFHIFDNFILLQNENYNLMLSFEQDFNDD